MSRDIIYYTIPITVTDPVPDSDTDFRTQTNALFFLGYIIILQTNSYFNNLSGFQKMPFGYCLALITSGFCNLGGHVALLLF